jgi:hypothetical protein
MTKSVRRATFEYLDGFTPNNKTILSGWGLFDMMYSKTGRKTTPATLLQYARDYADMSGSELTYTGKDQKYTFVPSGHKIGGAIC